MMRENLNSNVGQKIDTIQIKFRNVYKAILVTNRLTLSVSDEGYSRNQSFDFERI